MKKWKKYTAIAVTGGLLSFGVAFGVSQVCSYASTRLSAAVETSSEITTESTAESTSESLETPDAANSAQSGNTFQNNMSPQGMGGMGTMNNNVELADSPSEIVTGTTTNSAASLTVDKTNATTIVMSSSNNEVKIDKAGTYIITGTCSDGNITVKKGTEGVVLILKDLTLTSTTGAPLSINKEAEVKLVAEGTVNLTDAEDPADETSTDTTVADAFDGAVIKIKDGAVCYLTGTGTLNLDGSSCKNGIKTGSEEGTSLVIDGSLTLNVDAANDAINAGYDLAILGGTLTVNAGDDGLHAERILTVGEDGDGPTINIESSNEGIEATVVNLFGGNVTVNAADDGINAGSSDYSDTIDLSINITGGTYDIKAGYDGIDSNGNINIIGGSITINSANNGGDAGIDYDGTCYISDDADLNNNSGISGPDGGMGGPGGMGGMQGDMQQGGMGERPDMNGNMNGMQGGPNMNGNMQGRPERQMQQ